MGSGGTRAALVEAARSVFARRGYQAATVEEIAAEAGFTTGAVLRTILRRATLRGAGRRPERIGRRPIVTAPRRGTRAVLHSRAPAGDAGAAPQLASA
jgi:hypothetical protein